MENNTKYQQGYFKPRNPHKYKGNLHNIIYRSSWELSFMNYLDKNNDVVWWSSEELAIPYRSPIDNKYHRYFIDFVFKTKNGDVYAVEIKPEHQTKPPVLPKSGRKTKRYLREAKNYVVNQAKWEAAKKYCDKKGLKFVILTEKDLQIK